MIRGQTDIFRSSLEATECVQPPPGALPEVGKRASNHRMMITYVGRVFGDQANGRLPGDCQVGLYIEVKGVAEAVGRPLYMPYQLVEASRC